MHYYLRPIQNETENVANDDIDSYSNDIFTSLTTIHAMSLKSSLSKGYGPKSRLQIVHEKNLD